MRILYHHRTQADDGQAVHIRSLQRAFVEEGHELREVALVQRQEQGGGGNGRGFSPWKLVTRLPRFALELAEYGYGVTAAGRLAREAQRFRPDFVYERYAFGNTAGVRAARRAGVPLVLEVNSPLALELSRTRGLAFPGLAGRVERSIFAGADLVCVVTRVLGDMLEELGVPAERLLVTPNGVRLELYDAPDPRRARADLGLAERPAAGEVVLGFVGYFRDWHRLDLVLGTLARPGMESARLVLVGHGPARAGLEARAAELGVADRLHFAGSRPHDAIPGLLPAFDLALVPAINPYASPLKLHEYMAASLPVIAPDQANLREVLTHERDALLVEPGDEDALAAAIERLAGDAELRGRLGAAARRRIEGADLTWRGNARRVVRAVEGLLAVRGAGAAPEART